MELHNTVEDTIISKVNELLDVIEKGGNPDKLCTCSQCRMDTVCYALNRTTPHYIVSNRGVSRVQLETIERQQQEADMAALIYEGLKRVNHNQRPNVAHSAEKGMAEENPSRPVYNIPTIMGRIFNGNNFEPLSNVEVELLWDGKPVPMKNANWQNPCHIVSNMEGNFSFWPASAPASKVKTHKIFDYSLRVTSPEFETLIHVFKIPVASEVQPASSFALDRTFKLPDLYMFPPGEAEKNGYLD